MSAAKRVLEEDDHVRVPRSHAAPDEACQLVNLGGLGSHILRILPE